MKHLYNKESLQTIITILTIIFFGIFYWQTIMYLPLFGDATIHGYDAKTIIDRELSSLNTDYPPFYYFNMSILYSFLGETGFNLVPYIGLLFLLLSVFLFIKQITRNYYLSLLSIIFVGSSPKIIFYSARMYQEILLSALFIFCIFLLFKYLEEKKRSLLIIMLLFVGITLSIKQQGLLILYSTLIAFFTIEFIRKKLSILDLSAVVLIPFIIGLPFYGILFHTKGEIIPGSSEFKLLRIINKAGQKIFLHRSDKQTLRNLNIKVIPKALARDNSTKNDPLENKLEKIAEKYHAIGSTRGEDRHIWPTDIFLNFDKFNQANNLYLPSWEGKYLESPVIFYFSFFSLIAGFIYCILNYKQYSSLLIFSSIFLPNNYILFMRNTDQQRYQIFIPIFLTVFIFTFLHFIFKKIQINNKRKILYIALPLVFIFISVLSSRIIFDRRWINSQLYSSSVGGIKSVKEAGNWLFQNTDQSTKISQQCSNETQYYSNRKISGDWRVYFLDQDALKTYFSEKNISYYVIFHSQLVDDNEWHSLCWVPYSFYQKMENNYKKVFLSSIGDITIYETK